MAETRETQKMAASTYLALTILSALSLSPSNASPGRIRRWMISSFRGARPISVRLYSSAIASSETWQRARISAMITPVPVSTSATGISLVSYADASMARSICWGWPYRHKGLQQCWDWVQTGAGNSLSLPAVQWTRTGVGAVREARCSRMVRNGVYG